MCRKRWRYRFQSARFHLAQSISVSLFCHSDRKLRIAVLAVGKVVADVLLHIEISNVEIRRSRLQRASPFSISTGIILFSPLSRIISSVLIHSLNDAICSFIQIMQLEKLLYSQSKQNVQSNTTKIIFEKERR